MKNNAKNIFWGVFFILAAVWVVLGKNLPFFKGVSVWGLIIAAFCVAGLIKGIRKVDFGEILFSIAILAIIFDDFLHIQAYTPWPVLGGALLGTIGLNLIFKKEAGVHVYHNGHKVGKKEEMCDVISDDEVFKCDTSFSSGVKYVNCQNLKRADIENSFGSLTVYFDSARIEGNADISVDNSFGNTVLFIPKEWDVNLVSESSFGSIKRYGESCPSGDITVNLNVETSFGQIEINYV